LYEIKLLDKGSLFFNQNNLFIGYGIDNEITPAIVTVLNCFSIKHIVFWDNDIGLKSEEFKDKDIFDTS